MNAKKDLKRLAIKTNVRAGCGEDAPPPPPSDNGGSQPLSSLGRRISRVFHR